MTDKESPVADPTNRLCSEIQLFDLCDLDKCGYKKDRFCTNDALLDKFESIKEEDDRQALLYDEDEFDGEDESDFDELNEEYDGDEQD